MNNKYNEIVIPKELDLMINKNIKKEKYTRRILRTCWIAATALVLFTTSLNVSSTFADNMNRIPVIKDIASILTFRSYSTSTEEISSDVTIPSVSIEDSKLDEYINTTIETEVKRILDEAQIRAEEYKDAYISTGGTEEGYKAKNMTVSVDYEVFTQDENNLSFRVYTHESLAAVYAENLYFTLDLKSQKIITLDALLGDDYRQIISEEVTKQILKDEEKNPDKYFEDYSQVDLVIREDIDFYLKNSKLYVEFMKYELAPGVFGRITFEIPQ